MSAPTTSPSIRNAHDPARFRNTDQRLTRRESMIAALAADGMSNREIAVRLFISVRTVENHLQRIYHKLGIHSRLDLTTRR
ncbi:helix-turn-helix transcriptional regulator [Nocardia sp. NPDC050710]|uniref:response regulator transcription factor n=1 Tax=Nocardia sp. NPDC050710 TaxID=3157220 RepID=UPI003401549C